MKSLPNPECSILSAMRIVESNDNSNIRLNANGGNSILIVCEPISENEYIGVIKKTMDANKYQLIDLNDLLCEFVSANKPNLDDSFDLLKSSVPQIFKAPTGEEGHDLFGMILNAISGSLEAGKIPVLLHCGALYGTGIDNSNILENEKIMRASLPLIILYPATREKDKLMFLGSRSASKYRCMIIE
jgi:hypothetical protein